MAALLKLVYFSPKEVLLKISRAALFDLLPSRVEEQQSLPSGPDIRRGFQHELVSPCLETAIH